MTSPRGVILPRHRALESPTLREPVQIAGAIGFVSLFQPESPAEEQGVVNGDVDGREPVGAQIFVALPGRLDAARAREIPAPIGQILWMAEDRSSSGRRR